MPIMSVTLYATNSDLLVIARDQDAWSLGPLLSEMHGAFREDARTWLEGEWAPSEAGGQTAAALDGLRAVATCDGQEVTYLIDRGTEPIADLYVGNEGVSEV
jgi:hypothetical protein